MAFIKLSCEEPPLAPSAFGPRLPFSSVRRLHETDARDASGWATTQLFTSNFSKRDFFNLNRI